MQGCFSGHKPKAASPRRLRRKAVCGQFYEFGDVGINSVGSSSGYVLEMEGLALLLRHNSRVWRRYTRLCTIVGLDHNDTEADDEGVLSAVELGRYTGVDVVARGYTQTGPCQPSCC